MSRKTAQSATTSRVYVHKKCRGETVVSGDAFDNLSNPFTLVTGTQCCACNKAVNLGQVYWADTRETLAAYRRRVRRKAPLNLELGMAGAILLCGVIGAIIGRVIKPGETSPTIIGAFVGILPAWGVIPPFLARWIWKIDFRRIK